MLSFAQLVKEWRYKTYEYLSHFFKLQAREHLLIHQNNICCGICARQNSNHAWRVTSNELRL